MPTTATIAAVAMTTSLATLVILATLRIVLLLSGEVKNSRPRHWAAGVSRAARKRAPPVSCSRFID
jgi:hypothetical protein